jgi:predicted anti-sigma-YlaC factor YlaD
VVIAVPHYFFWPFDIGRSQADRERTRAKTHIADALRVGVLAEEEGAELRIEGHLMACELCREPSISLWERAREEADPAAFVRRYSCLRTRNAVLRHLDEDRPLPEAAVTHLRECIGCANRFLEPGKALHTLDVDETAVSAQD